MAEYAAVVRSMIHATKPDHHRTNLLHTMTVCTSSVHSDAFDEYVQGLTELPVFYFRAAEILAIWEWFYYEELCYIIPNTILCW